MSTPEFPFQANKISRPHRCWSISHRTSRIQLGTPWKMPWGTRRRLASDPEPDSGKVQEPDNWWFDAGDTNQWGWHQHHEGADRVEGPDEDGENGDEEEEEVVEERSGDTERDMDQDDDEEDQSHSAGSGESDSDMTGTRSLNPLSNHRWGKEEPTTLPAGSSTPQAATSSDGASMSSRIVAQLTSSLSQLAQTQKQQQEAISMLGRSVEEEVTARAADVSLLANKFKNMRLAAAEERVEILEELRRGRAAAPAPTPPAPWVASQAAAAYASARQTRQTQGPTPEQEAPSTPPPRKKKRDEEWSTPTKTSKGVGDSKKTTTLPEKEKEKSHDQPAPMQVDTAENWEKNSWAAAGWDYKWEAEDPWK